LALLVLFPPALHRGPLDLPPDPLEALAARIRLEQPPEAFQIDEEVPGQEDPVPEWVVSGSPESIPLLIRYLQDQEEIGQLAALAELASMGPRARRGVPAILEALKDPKSSIRLEAARTLLLLNVRVNAAIRALLEELKAGNATARARAASVIADLVAPPQVICVSCWGPDPPPRIARPWVGLRTLPGLVAALADREPKVRAQAAQTVGLIGGGARAAGPPLLRALKDEDASVRQAAAQALQRVDRAAAEAAGIK
jgi:HEAT repeat protein